MRNNKKLLSASIIIIIVISASSVNSYVLGINSTKSFNKNRESPLFMIYLERSTGNTIRKDIKSRYIGIGNTSAIPLPHSKINSIIEKIKEKPWLLNEIKDKATLFMKNPRLLKMLLGLRDNLELPDDEEYLEKIYNNCFTFTIICFIINLLILFFLLFYMTQLPVPTCSIPCPTLICTAQCIPTLTCYENS